MPARSNAGFSAVQALVMAAIASIFAVVLLDTFNITTRLRQSVDESNDHEILFTRIRQVLHDEEACTRALGSTIQAAPCNPTTPDYCVATWDETDLADADGMALTKINNVTYDAVTSPDELIMVNDPNLDGYQVTGLRLKVVAKYDSEPPKDYYLARLEIDTEYQGTKEMVGGKNETRTFYLNITYDATQTPRVLDRCYGGISQIPTCEAIGGAEAMEEFRCTHADRFAILPSGQTGTWTDTARLTPEGSYIGDDLVAAGTTRILSDLDIMAFYLNTADAASGPSALNANPRRVCLDGDLCAGEWAPGPMGCAWVGVAPPTEASTPAQGAPGLIQLGTETAIACPKGFIKMATYRSWGLMDRYRTGIWEQTLDPHNTPGFDYQIQGMYCCDGKWWDEDLSPSMPPGPN